MADKKADAETTFPVEICYALPDQLILIDLQVTEGTCLEQAVRQSGILDRIPEIDLSINHVGIFGKLKPLSTPLRSHDRIEIYRPLTADPKEARRRRAQKTV